MHAAQTSQRFVGVSAALFIGSAALTIAWCNSMHDMAMCSTRPATPVHEAITFLAMWLTMMVAMMLPSLMPMLFRYRRSVEMTSRADALTACVGLGYFFVWLMAGVVAFIGNAIVAEAASAWLAHRMSLAVGIVAFAAGVLQFSRWKMHHLACCRDGRTCCALSAATAWRYGLRLGVHCVHCCFGLTLVLLAAGMMDLRAMALVTAAISIERLAPGGVRAARFVGIALIATGAFLVA